MQIENGKTGNEWMGASLDRTNTNELIAYVIFGNGDSITFDKEFYIVRCSAGFDIHKDERADEGIALVAKLMVRQGYALPWLE